MQITYLFDPLCGWCYGASPALEQIAGTPGVRLTLAPTGLFAGRNARPMDRQFAEFAWSNDQRIARLTGQPFSQAYYDHVLGDGGSKFDSRPATLALIAIGLNKTADAVLVLKALQKARYQAGSNTSDSSVVSSILTQLGFADAVEQVLVPSDDLLLEYDRVLARSAADMAKFGANGVPALVLGQGADRHLEHSAILFGGAEKLNALLQAA